MEDSLTTQLSENEKKELETLEGIIAKSMKSFVAVGNALLKIRNSKLYRQDFRSFNDYCRVRWGMGKSYAAYLISGSQVAANLLPHDDHPGGQLCSPCEIQPVHEKQIRPLSILEPAQQCEVWKEAVRSADGKTITYKQVKALVDELVGPAAVPPPKKKDPYAHSDAFAFANIAILQLERIRDDDPLRFEGLNRVTKWIQEKLTIWTTNGKGERNANNSGN